VTPLSGPEKAIARSNALKTLGAERFPTIRFRADEIVQAAGRYRLTGDLEIRGKARPRAVDVEVEEFDDRWRLSCETPVRQSEFGIKPYSMFMGSMKVADEVTVAFTAWHPKNRDA
jgi:polyisoprenoid-binding protein YceI